MATRQSELEGASCVGDTSQEICHLKKATVDARTLNVPTSSAQLLQLMLRNFSSSVALIALSLPSKFSDDFEEENCWC